MNFKKAILLTVGIVFSLQVRAATVEAVFDGPSNNLIDQKTIELINNIKNAGPGGKIYGAFYFINNIDNDNDALQNDPNPGVTLKDTLIDAANAGTDIHIVSEINRLGGSNFLPSIVGSYANGGSIQYTECNHSCMRGIVGTSLSNNNIMHNKFWAMRSGNNALYYVTQGSKNYNYSQQLSHQNMVVIGGDSEMFWEHKKTFDDMLNYRFTFKDNYYRTYNGLNSKVYFFPRKSGDLIQSVLNNVDPDNGACRITIAMATWTASRISIINSLKNYSYYGCQVTAIADTHEISASALSELRKPTPIGGVPRHHNVSVVRHNRMHSKYMLIDAYYGSSRQKNTWTGSANFSYSANRYHDESILKVYDDGKYNQFLNNWKTIGNDGCDANGSVSFTKLFPNAPGNDSLTANGNGEWVEIKANSASSGRVCVNVSGWSVADAANNKYTFPSGSYLDVGQSIRIYSGCKAGFTPKVWSSSDSRENYFYNWVFGSTKSSAPAPNTCGGIWNNGGDTAILRNASNVERDRCTYGSGTYLKNC